MLNKASFTKKQLQTEIWLVVNCWNKKVRQKIYIDETMWQKCKINHLWYQICSSYGQIAYIYFWNMGWKNYSIFRKRRENNKCPVLIPEGRYSEGSAQDLKK